MLGRFLPLLSAPHLPFWLFELRVSQEGRPRPGPQGCPLAPVAAARAALYRFIVISSSQTEGSREPPVAALWRRWKNNPAKVVLGDTPNPSLEEKGPLGSENNYCFFLSAFIFSLSSLSLCRTYLLALLPDSGPSLFPAQRGMPQKPLKQHNSAPSTSEGWLLVAFLLCHLAHVSQLRFHSVLCQVWSFVLTSLCL